MTHDTALEALRAWAESVGARLIREPGLTGEEISMFPELIEPHFGELSFKVPPSYRALLQTCGGFRVEFNYGDQAGEDWGEVTAAGRLFTPDEIIHGQGMLGTPEGVRDESGRMMTTNHLIGFAATAPHGNSCWCFITDQERDGELAIVVEDTTEMTNARYADDGAYVSPDLINVEFWSCAEWLSAYVGRICSLSPSEFRRII